MATGPDTAPPEPQSTEPKGPVDSPIVLGSLPLIGKGAKGGLMSTQEPRTSQVLKVLVRLRVQGLVEVQTIRPRQGNAKIAVAFQPLGLRSALSATATGPRVTSTGGY